MKIQKLLVNIVQVIIIAQLVEQVVSIKKPVVQKVHMQVEQQLVFLVLPVNTTMQLEKPLKIVV